MDAAASDAYPPRRTRSVCPSRFRVEQWKYQLPWSGSGSFGQLLPSVRLVAGSRQPHRFTIAPWLFIVFSLCWWWPHLHPGRLGKNRFPDWFTISVDYEPSGARKSFSSVRYPGFDLGSGFGLEEVTG
ncbi:hypothetical protein Van01_37920 [Micromonospora andamanensis]|uniref:Uncharacterized protein n=1 Tax=Micromonospora andamanensis TaxID=1287068 RepID=A0ABQ4HY56_9ACTN|nr:hypothetical protein Van01_37920 [Micromonospora andamanensis]